MAGYYMIDDELTADFFADSDSEADIDYEEEVLRETREKQSGEEICDHCGSSSSQPKIMEQDNPQPSTSNPEPCISTTDELPAELNSDENSYSTATSGLSSTSNNTSVPVPAKRLSSTKEKPLVPSSISQNLGRSDLTSCVSSGRERSQRTRRIPQKCTTFTGSSVVTENSKLDTDTSKPTPAPRLSQPTTPHVSPPQSTANSNTNTLTTINSKSDTDTSKPTPARRLSQPTTHHVSPPQSTANSNANSLTTIMEDQAAADMDLALNMLVCWIQEDTDRWSDILGKHESDALLRALKTDMETNEDCDASNLILELLHWSSQEVKQLRLLDKLFSKLSADHLADATVSSQNNYRDYKAGASVASNRSIAQCIAEEVKATKQKLCKPGQNVHSGSLMTILKCYMVSDEYQEHFFDLITKPDEKGCSLLMWIIVMGVPAILNLVINQLTPALVTKAITAKNKHGRNSVTIAVMNGCEETLNVLIKILDKNEHDSIITSPDKKGSNSVMWAAKLGEIGAVQTLLSKLVLARQVFAIKSKNTDQMNSVMFACEHKDILQLLLKIVDTLPPAEQFAVITSYNKAGQNPVVLSAMYGNKDLLTMLLERLSKLKWWGIFSRTQKDLATTIKWQDRDGNNSVMWAAKTGHEQVMETLLDQLAPHHQVEAIAAQDKDGCNAVAAAASNGHHIIIEQLIERLSHDQRLNVINSSLPCVSAGNERALNRLLEYLDGLLVDVTSLIAQQNSNGRSLVMQAASKGHTVVLKFLLDRLTHKQQFDAITSCCVNQQNSVILAAVKNHKDTLNMLLERLGKLKWSGISSTIVADMIKWRDRDGKNSVMWAAEKGHEQVMEILLDQLAPHDQVVYAIAAQKKEERNAFMVAASYGRQEILRKMLDRLSHIEQRDVISAHDFGTGYNSVTISVKKGHNNTLNTLLTCLDELPPHYQVVVADMIKQQDAEGWNSVKWAVLKNHEMVTTILDRLTPEQQVEEIISQDRAGRNSVILCARKGKEKVLDVLLDRLNQLKSMFRHQINVADLVTHQDVNGRNSVMSAARSGNSKFLQKLLHCLLPRQRFDAIASQDRDGRNAIMIASLYGQQGTLEVMLDALSDHQKLTAVTACAGKSGHNSVMISAKHGHNDTLESLLKCLKGIAPNYDVSVTDYIMKQDNEKRSAVTFAVINNDGKMMSTLLARLGNQQVIEVINEHGKIRGVNAFLFAAAHEDYLDVLQQFINNLEPCQLQELVQSSVEQNAEATVRILENIQGNERAVESVPDDLELNRCAQLLMYAIQENKPQTIFSLAAKHMKNIIRLPLDVSQLNTLNRYSTQFVLPNTLQHGSQRYSMVFYNCNLRRGAQEEATSVNHQLQLNGFSSDIFPWKTFSDLQNDLEKELKKIKAACNLLFISIMSHGFRGCLEGDEGSFGTINSLLQIISKHMQLYIPVVIMVQACQSRNEGQKLVAERDIDEGNIVLQRPNTVLLLSTIADGNSLRGIYSKEIALEVSGADGIKDIWHMHLSATDAVTTSLTSFSTAADAYKVNQIPEYRSTLLKQLILPCKDEQEKTLEEFDALSTSSNYDSPSPSPHPHPDSDDFEDITWHNYLAITP